MLKIATVLFGIPWVSASLKWILLLQIRSAASEHTLEVFIEVSFFIKLSDTYVVTGRVDGAGESVCLGNTVRTSCSFSAIILWVCT